jgi:hypothetical protein
MGFIPLPLGVVMLRVVYTSMKSTNPGKNGTNITISKLQFSVNKYREIPVT